MDFQREIWLFILQWEVMDVDWSVKSGSHLVAQMTAVLF